MKRRRTNSTVSSLDDSGLSICGSSSRTSSPTSAEASAHNANGSAEHGAGISLAAPTSFLPHHPPPAMESILHYQQQLQHIMTMQQFSQAGPNWLDFALYFSRSNGGGIHPTMMSPVLSPSPVHPQTLQTCPGSAFELASPTAQSPAISPVSVTNNEEKVTKCRSFTIDAILGK